MEDDIAVGVHVSEWETGQLHYYHTTELWNSHTNAGISLPQQQKELVPGKRWQTSGPLGGGGGVRQQGMYVCMTYAGVYVHQTYLSIIG